MADNTQDPSDPTFTANLGDALGGTVEHLAGSAEEAQRRSGAEQTEVNYEYKGGQSFMTFRMPAEFGQQAINKMNIADGVQREYQKMLAQNQQQLQAIQSHPFANTLAQIAAGVSSQSKNPIVRGIGIGAERLNPTVEQLQGQRMGLLGESAKLAESQARIDATKMQHEDMAQYHKDVVGTKLREDRGRIEKDAGISARRGDFDKDSYVQELVAAGETPERARAAAERLDTVSKAAQLQQKAAQAQKDKDLAEKEMNFQKGLDARAANTDKLIAAAQARADAAAARGEKKETAKEEKKKEPGPVPRKQLSDLSGADNALDEIEKILKDPANQSLMGPYAGRAREFGSKVAPGVADPEGKIKGLIGKLGLQTAQAIKATGAGARGFGPMERPYFEKLAEGIHNTPQQNLKIVENWRAYLDQERRGIMTANPDVDWTTKYAPALGKRLGTPAATETKKYPWEQ